MDLILDDLTIEIRRKNIKNLHIGVYPPDGEVRISAPMWIDDDHIRQFVISKLSWIRKNQQTIRSQPWEKPHEYLNQETHMVWGRPYLLKINKRPGIPEVTLDYSNLILHIKPDVDKTLMHETLQCWYRQILYQAARPRMEIWRNKLNLPEITLRVRHMKTRWGSCNPRKRNIRLNTDLAKKPYECLDYVIIHELLHFFEPNHGPNFYSLMDKYMPQWRNIKQRLNMLPASY